MRFQSSTTRDYSVKPPWARRTAATLGALAIALLTCTVAVADPVPQFGVTAVNANRNALYNVILTPNAIPNTGATITGTQVLNTDASNHKSFFAVVRAPNSVTSALDLIVADATKHQIVRYAGPGPTYAPSTTIFNYSGSGSGPSVVTGLAADAAGNVYAASAGLLLDKPALWILPFNATANLYCQAAAGAFCPPILIDNSFGGILNLSLGETVVASVAASALGNAAPAWNQGDVLLLISSAFNGARVLVYSQAAVAGVLSSHVPLTGPTSVAVGPSQFGSEKPTGIDVWPADATYPASGHGVSLLMPTYSSGRVMRFDSSTGAFISDFADGLGSGLLKIKVGTYSTFPYAFVAQSKPGTGRIMQFGAPPASGANTPLSSTSTGVNNPEGLAVTSSASVPIGGCINSPANPCAPLGAQLQTSVTATNTLNPNNPLLEQSCVITDPRVTASVSAGTWSCAGGTLDAANFCQGFPSTVYPPWMCGHSGPTGNQMVAVMITAKAVDQDPGLNNSFIQQTVDASLPLPGPLDLKCPQEEMIAFASRSDLPLIEGFLPEWFYSVTNGVPSWTQPQVPYFIDITGSCDSGSGKTGHLSMISYGAALNSSPTGLARGLPGFVDDKFNNLTETISNAAAQISDGGATQNYVTQAQTYFDNGVKNTDPNGYACAMNTIATADAYVTGNQAGNPAFSGGTPPAGNLNPAGDIDGRLANLFLTIDLYFLNPPPNTPTPNREWPTQNVPPCVTFTASPATVIIPGGSAQLTWSSTGSYPAASCVLSATDGTFTTKTTFTGPGGTAPTGTLNGVGTYSAQLLCSSAAMGTITGFAQTTVNVIQLASISVTPASPQIPAGGSANLTAIGSYSDNSTQNLTSSLVWTAKNVDPNLTMAVATVSGGSVNCVSTATTATMAQITATDPNSQVSGSVTVTCLAPTLNSITVNPQSQTIAAGGQLPMTATAGYSFGPTQDVTGSSSTTWTASPSAAATVTGAGIVTCISTMSTPQQVTVTATNSGVSGSTGVICQAPVLTSVSVTTLGNLTVAAGGQVPLTATANYSYPAGTMVDVTGTASWMSSNTLVATVSGAGVVTCISTMSMPPAVTISATSGGVIGSTTVNCQAPVLTSVSVTTLGSLTVAAGGQVSLTATANYSYPAGTMLDVTSSASWMSSDPATAVVSGGVVTCVSTASMPPAATITATSNGVAGTAVVSCQAPVLTSVSVTPANQPLAAGATLQMAATANYSYPSGTMVNVTGSAGWTASPSTAAMVSSTGAVTCIATAATLVTVTATSGGIPGSTTVNCQAPVLQSVTVTPPTPTVVAGGTVQLAAAANYSYPSGSTLNVTGSASWSITPSSPSGVATVSATGLVACVSTASTAMSVGIAATSGGVTGTATVTCQAPVLTSIAVTPPKGSPSEITDGGTRQLTATGTYTYGATQNVTTLAAWTSSATSVATVSAAGLVSCKYISSKTDATATISAKIGTTTGSLKVTCDSKDNDGD